MAPSPQQGDTTSRKTRAASSPPAAPAARAASAPARRSRARYLEALLDGQAAVLEMIAQGQPLPSILEVITRWVEAHSPSGVLASILLVDPDGQRLLHGAAPSLPPAYTAAIHGLPIGPSVGSCGSAAFTKQTVIVEDIAHDARWADYRELALAHGLRACWSTPLLAGNGRVLGTFALYYRQPNVPTTQDLSLVRLVARTTLLAIEHQQATDARAQAEQATAHLAAIVTSSTDAIASKTLEGIVTSWNASAERMFGYTAEEMIGQPITRLFPPERLTEEDRILARLRAGERIEHFETVRMTKDGRRLEVSLTISPIRDQTGTVIGASKIVRDITEHKRLERERAELLGIVAHDLGNPVAAMKARVQLLERQVARGQVPEVGVLHTLGETVARMERLVQDLRDVEGFEAGHLTLVRQRCDLVALVRHEVALAQAATGRRVTLALRDGPAGPNDRDEPDEAVAGSVAAVRQTAIEVEVDRDRIGQVVANLLSNALKYSPADQPVELTLTREEQPTNQRIAAQVPPAAEDRQTGPTPGAGGVTPAAGSHADRRGEPHQPFGQTWVRVAVRDAGPGIPPDALAHLFERFFRVPGIEVQHGERRGLGLGLYICRQLIERHGGRLEVTSMVGHGSTFSFTLPLAEPARGAVAACW